MYCTMGARSIRDFEGRVKQCRYGVDTDEEKEIEPFRPCLSDIGKIQ